MKISEAIKSYSAQIHTLVDKSTALTKLLQESEKNPQNFDRVEISRELALTKAQYEEVFNAREEISAMQSAIHNAEVARQQSEVMQEASEDFMKILTIMRRIMAGDKVPPQDEQKLMEYSSELYTAAKTAAMAAQNTDGKEHESLWDEEEDPTEERPPANEVAANTEINVPSPEAVAASVEMPE